MDPVIERAKKELRKEYGKNVSLSDAKRKVEKRLGLAAGRLVSLDVVYFLLVAEDYPLALSSDSTVAEIRSAVRKRRDGKDGATLSGEARYSGRSLRRWETVARSAEVALGRKFPVSEAVRLYGEKESYIGRGTRAAAPSTRDAGSGVS